MNFETLARLSRIENSISVLEKAVLTLKAQVEELKEKPVEQKRETLTLRKRGG